LLNLRIAAAVQQRWHLGEADEPGWEELPEETRASVLALLARLIAKGVIEEQKPDERS
jgi:hypothetical protein